MNASSRSPQVESPHPLASGVASRGLGHLLRSSAAAQMAEVVLVFLLGAAVIAVGWVAVGDNLFARQVVAWIANVVMLAAVWTGLRVRGQSLVHFGFGFRFGGVRVLFRTIAQSVLIVVLALAAFVAGSMLMASVAPAPQAADMSGYDYMRGNLPMLLLALAGVYIVSSFGEEMLYRGFLITRLAEIGKGSKGAWWIAAGASSAIFGLAHFSWGIVGVVQTTLMGIVLAVAYLATKRVLWPLVLAHLYIDTLLLVQLYANSPARAME